MIWTQSLRLWMSEVEMHMEETLLKDGVLGQVPDLRGKGTEERGPAGASDQP
jgi:hypothetical protein